MYLDPGFGGMLVQVIIALAATGGALLFAFRRKISTFMKKKKGGGNTQNMSSATPSTEDLIDVLSDEPSDNNKNDTNGPA